MIIRRARKFQNSISSFQNFTKRAGGRIAKGTHHLEGHEYPWKKYVSHFLFYPLLIVDHYVIGKRYELRSGSSSRTRHTNIKSTD